MLRSLFGFDWKKSPAHLLLLSKFFRPRTVKDFSKSDAWKRVLGETPRRAIKRFLDEGMIERASLAGLLEYKYKVSDLKKMLKQHGLPVSGRKANLIERLVQADPEGMKKATRRLTVLQCSEQGQIIAEQFLAYEKEKRARVEQQVLDTLRKRRFKDACQSVALFEAKQVFPRGLYADWKNYDSSYDVAMLKFIFASRPKKLAQLADTQLEQLRVAAGMAHLWGTQPEDYLPTDFETGLHIEADVAARMLFFHASYQRDMAQYRAWGVKKVEILTANDSHTCPACRKLKGKKYSVSKVPELPYEKCTSEMGCRCTLVSADF